MEHKGTVVLETERLILRKFKIEDVQDMFANWSSDYQVTKYLTWGPHENVEITRLIVNDWIKGYEENAFYQWAIELKEIGQPIGSISVARINENVNAVEIGYCIGKKWWGKGYTAEAFKEIIKFLFNEVGAKRICAKHDTDNPNSGKVMIKAGLQYEGTLRKAGKNSSNSVCDLAVYAILNY